MARQNRLLIADIGTVRVAEPNAISQPEPSESSYGGRLGFLYERSVFFEVNFCGQRYSSASLFDPWSRWSRVLTLKPTFGTAGRAVQAPLRNPPPYPSFLLPSHL